MKLEKWAIGIAATVAAVSLFAVFPLPSWWFEINRFRVMDAQAGQPIIVDYDRTIWRNFEGQWRVEVWRDQRANWVSHCVANGGPQEYRTDTVLPDPVTMDWLAYTEPRCFNLPQGTYKVSVQITVNPGGFWSRTVQAVSPPLVIR